MTDNEIIKALECCLIECGECTVCPLKHIKSVKCLELLNKNAYNLINRQKEEIEELTTRNDKLKNHFTIKFDNDKLKEIVKKAAEKIEIDIKQTKSEAIREFAEKLKERLAEDCDRVCERSSLLCGSISGYPIYEVEDCIDNLVKEMECGDNGKNDTEF